MFYSYNSILAIATATLIPSGSSTNQAMVNFNDFGNNKIVNLTYVLIFQFNKLFTYENNKLENNYRSQTVTVNCFTQHDPI